MFYAANIPVIAFVEQVPLVLKRKIKQEMFDLEQNHHQEHTIHILS